MAGAHDPSREPVLSGRDTNRETASPAGVGCVYAMAAGAF